MERLATTATTTTEVKLYKHALHGHHLKQIWSEQLWRCDGKTRPGGCRRTIQNFQSNFPRFRCDACDFDLCDLCLADENNAGIRHPLHSHELSFVSTPRGRWTCDGTKRLGGCRSRFPGAVPQGLRFRCYTCDYDLCELCITDFDTSTNSAVYDPIHPHALRHNGKEQVWVCDGRRTPGGCKSGVTYHKDLTLCHRFSCANGCDFDLCGACVKDAGKVNVVHPRHPHPLALCGNGGDGWKCDGSAFPERCATGITDFNQTKGVTRYRCTMGCDFDLCQKCVFKASVAELREAGTAVIGKSCRVPDVIPAGVVVKPQPIVPPPAPVVVVESPAVVVATTTTSVKEVDVQQEESFCVVCMEGPKNAVLVHQGTGHQACCMECAQTLFKKKQPCPICRAPILMVIKNFMT